MIFNEDLIPVAHRFNDIDCGLSADEKLFLSFLSKDLAGFIWNKYVSSSVHLSLLQPSDFAFKAKKIDELAWEDCSKGIEIFLKLLANTNLVICLWGPECACILPVNIFIKAWDDFFYPSDESTVLVIPEKEKVIYVFNGDLFHT